MLTTQHISDLHLEFDPDYRPQYAGADLLILAGDICVANYLTRSEDSPYHWKAEAFRDFFKYCSDTWKDVIYIKGNHESYQGRYTDTTDILSDELERFANIHFLDKQKIELNGLTFLGATMWTDMNKANPITSNTIQGGLNDYRVITYNDSGRYRKLIPYDTISEHRSTLDWISTEHDLCETPMILITHHAPSLKSIHQKYHSERDYHMNFGYVSDRDDFILEHTKITDWFHGHTHTSFEYEIGSCSVHCNPKGYGSENPSFNDMNVITLGNNK